MIDKHVLFLLGDSTCSPYKLSERPRTGWGEEFYHFVNDDWIVDDRAISGRSTKSFIAEGAFDRVIKDAKEGDVAIIQFGHNDPKPDEARFSDPYTGYVDNLVYMYQEFQKKGVDVYFASSIARRQFAPDGTICWTHGEYPAAMHYAAFKVNRPCINTSVVTMVELQKYGDEGSKRFFMNFPSGVYENYPEGSKDNTHLTSEGARWVSYLVARELSRVEPRPVFLSSNIQESWHEEDVTGLEVAP